MFVVRWRIVIGMDGGIVIDCIIIFVNIIIIITVIVVVFIVIGIIGVVVVLTIIRIIIIPIGGWIGCWRFLYWLAQLPFKYRASIVIEIWCILVASQLFNSPYYMRGDRELIPKISVDFST
jgi:hypothetical protein